MLASAVLAQKKSPKADSNDDAVLFTVAGKPIQVSEFRYIYSKTNQENADFSEKSLREYLDLYTTFKLKVAKARQMQLDTVPTLNEELNGYRKQLSNSYLVDKEVTDKLVREVFDRMQRDVDVSHIFIAVDKNAAAADTLKAFKRAMNWHKLISSGKVSFEQMAQDSSDDKSAKDNRGNIGYINAMLPDGFYNFEKAAYSAKPGQLLAPVRSNTGYHIIRVNGSRPARGKMEVSHILFRRSDDPAKNAAIKTRADSVHQLLANGGDWDILTARFSDDKLTAPKKGYLGVFGINQYQKTFEDAAYALAKDGDISKPVETTIGWHIIRRVSQRPVQNFETEKRGLTERVKRDSRSEIAKQSMISRIKSESKYQDYPQVFEKWAARQIDTIFFTFKWKPDPAKPKDVLMRLGTQSYTVADFEEYAAKASRERMRGFGLPLKEVVDKMFKNWSDETAMAYEEAHLGEKYPEFSALMREYEEGILLFEALKQNVWDRANSDSAGLQAYFDANLKDKYKWDERARATLYTIKTDDPKIGQEIRTYAANHNSEEVLRKFNKPGETDVLTSLEKTYEKGKMKDLADVWKAGASTNLKTDNGTKTATFTKIEEILPPSGKSLSEARGYAVADYQDYLEKQWIAELRREFPVQVNEEVFRKLIK